VTQQINLFNPLLLKQRKQFSAGTMLLALAAVVVLMGALYAYQYARLAELRRQAASASQSLQNQKAQLANLTAALPQSGQGQSPVDQQIKDTDAEIAAKQALLHELGGGATGSFAGYLRALARQAVPGVWLTAVHIGDSGDDLSVTGRATHADLVPELVRRLNSEVLLRGRPFETLDVRRVVAEHLADGSDNPAGGAPDTGPASPASQPATPGLQPSAAGTPSAGPQSATSGSQPAAPGATGSMLGARVPQADMPGASPYVTFALASKAEEITWISVPRTVPAAPAASAASASTAPAAPAAAPGVQGPAARPAS
jgi:Tfp pilus assembly protein PilN